MSSIDKIRTKFFERPYRTDLCIDDVRKFLTSYGFVERKRDAGTSHVLFSHPEGIVICVATISGKGVKACYIRECVHAVSGLKEENRK